MGRPRKSNSTLPPSYFLSHGAVYRVVKGAWRRVGTAADAHADYAQRLRMGTAKSACDPLIDAAFDAMKARTVKRLVRVGDQLVEKVVPALAENTRAQYEVAARKLKKILQNFAPGQVMPKHAAAIKLGLIKTPNMCNRVLSFARQVFAHGLEHQLVEINPFVGIKRHEESKRTRLITWEEWWKIRAVAPRRLQLVMDGLYLTDQRIDDLLALDERDGLEAGILFTQAKTGKGLIIKWNADRRAWWEACRELHGKVVKVNFEIKDRPRPLFRARHGGRPAYRTVYDQWVLAVERAGVVDCNLHDNRAFSATEMKRQAGGGEQGEIAAQRLLGHDERRNTKIYLRGREIEVVDGPEIPENIRRLLGGIAKGS